MKKTMLALSAVVMLMVVSCKKSKNSPRSGCLLTQEMDEDGKIKAAYTYDSKGRVLTETWDGSVVITYTYSADKIIQNENDNGVIYIRSYSLDGQGRIVSSNSSGGDYTYTYNVEGYLASITNKKFNWIGKYTWSNGNLVKMEGYGFDSPTPSDITTFEYSTDICPVSYSGSFYANQYGVSGIFGSVIKYCGKPSKNLLVKATTNDFDDSATYTYTTETYTYTKDSKGNITSVIGGVLFSGGYISTMIRYNYDCK